jgi:hypothetical protein
MKIKTEIELDWIDDESNVDEEIKNQIVKQVYETVEKNMIKSMTEKIEEKINSDLLSKIDQSCNDMITSFLGKKITISDKWGDAVMVNKTVEEVLKKNFEDYWQTPVSKDGRSDGSSYGHKQPRLVWIIDETIKKEATSFAEDLKDSTEKKIKEYVTENLKEKIGENIVKNIGLKNLLIENKKN